MKTVIINGGNIEDDFALAFLKKQGYDYLIAVDHGMEFAKRAGLMPDEILGDFDSADPTVRQYYEQQHAVLHRYPPEKDYTDMELAMRLALEKGSTEILVLGATGTRIDHVLGSIWNLTLAAEENVPCALVDAHNRIRMLKGPGLMQIKKAEQFGKYVSILAHGGDASGVTLRGFAYPLTDAVLGAGLALGISNQICEETAEIRLQKGSLLVIESRD